MSARVPHVIVKRGTERDSISDLDERDAVPQGPLPVERLAPAGPRRRLGLPILVGLCIAVALVALAGRALDWYEASSRVTPAPPTPISWVDTIVTPAASSSAASSALATAAPSGRTAVPSMLPAVTASAILTSFFGGPASQFTSRST